MTIDINGFSYDELVTLNDEIVERLKFLYSSHAYQEMASLGLGTIAWSWD